MLFTTQLLAQAPVTYTANSSLSSAIPVPTLMATPQFCEVSVVYHMNQPTKFTLSGTSACGYPVGTYDSNHYAAIDGEDFGDPNASGGNGNHQGAFPCGACAALINSSNNDATTVMIVDECPQGGVNQLNCWAGSYHLDLAPGAYNDLSCGSDNCGGNFSSNSDTSGTDGSTVYWHFVQCPLTGEAAVTYANSTGKIAYEWQNSSSSGYSPLMFLDMLFPIKSVTVNSNNETRDNGSVPNFWGGLSGYTGTLNVTLTSYEPSIPAVSFSMSSNYSPIESSPPGTTSAQFQGCVTGPTYTPTKTSTVGSPTATPTPTRTATPLAGQNCPIVISNGSESYLGITANTGGGPTASTNITLSSAAAYAPSGAASGLVYSMASTGTANWSNAYYNWAAYFTGNSQCYINVGQMSALSFEVECPTSGNVSAIANAFVWLVDSAGVTSASVTINASPYLTGGLSTSWQNVAIPISAFNIPGGFTQSNTWMMYLQVQTASNGQATTLYLNDLAFYPKSCPTNTPTASNTATKTATATATNTSPSTPTFTPTATHTSTSTATTTPTRTPTFTATNTPPATSTFTPTLTSTFTATRTNTATATVTNTPTVTSTNTATSTTTNTRTSTTTYTPSNTATFTFTGQPTNTFTSTPTNTFTGLPTNTATATATKTMTSTATSTATPTATKTPTLTTTNTVTSTATITSTFTFTGQPTNTPTATPTNTFTGQPTSTPTATPTHTFTGQPTNTPTFTPTSTTTRTSTSTPTNTTSLNTSTATSTPTSTPTTTFTPTITDTPTNTTTGTQPPTSTPTNTPTVTSTFSPTNTATNTATSTATSSPTPITVTASGTNLGNSNQLPGASGVTVGQVQFTNSNNSTVVLNSLTVSVSGGNPGDVTVLTLVNGSGNTVATATVSGGTATFSFSGSLGANSSSTYVVEATFSSGANNTYNFSTGSATGSNGQAVQFNWTSPSVATVTVRPATSTPTTTATASPTMTATITPSPMPTSTGTSTPVLQTVVGPPFPNPSDGDQPVTLWVHAPGNSLARLDVFTTAFRKIAEPVVSQDAALPLQWDFKDSSGSPVASGLYYLRVQVTGPQPTVKIFKVLLVR